VLVEGNFSFEREDYPGMILGFLNNFSESGTATTGLGSGVFLVKFLG
jgi:hypothetical protein